MFLLFHKESCPYCAKVRDFIADNNIDVVLVDSPTGSKSREILVKLGGQDQVPFLVDTDEGKVMYESADIIEYLGASK